MIAAGKGRILQIATTSAIGTGLIPTAMAELKNAELPYETHVGLLLASTVAQEVRSGRAEMGFSSLPLDTPGLDVLRLYSAPVVVALPEGDALAEFDVVPLSAFAGRRIATLLNPLRFQSHIARMLAAHGIETGPVVRTNTAYSAVLIANKMGAAAIVDPVTAYGLSLPGVVIRPVDMAVPFYWGVLVGQKRPVRAVAQALMEAVEGVAERSIAGFAKLDPGMAGQLVTGPGSSIHYGTGT